MLSSLIESGTTIQPKKELLICIATSLVLGLLVATIHMQRNVYTKSFVVTVAVLPILVQSVIMLVNGNLGTGLAVVGAFSLIRFRSVAGGSRERSLVFLVDGYRDCYRDGLRCVRGDILSYRRGSLYYCFIFHLLATRIK